MRTHKINATMHQIRLTKKNNPTIWDWVSHQTNLTQSVIMLIEMAQSVSGDEDWPRASQKLAMEYVLDKQNRPARADRPARKTPSSAVNQKSSSASVGSSASHPSNSSSSQSESSKSSQSTSSAKGSDNQSGNSVDSSDLKQLLGGN